MLASAVSLDLKFSFVILAIPAAVSDLLNGQIQIGYGCGACTGVNPRTGV